MHPDLPFCRAMLPRVSRTFAACIHLLPPGLEEAVLVAYLLCRVADTIEDAPMLPGARKRELLAAFAAALDDHDGAAAVAAAFDPPTTDDERLAAGCGRVLACFAALPAGQRQAIRPWVVEMCAGMATVAARRGDTPPGRLFALTNLADLDHYCWFVAGTVGHLLTDLFARHGRPLAAGRYRALKGLATAFGFGLQLTNIIKDVADDRRRDWSYVPADLCRRMGIAPEELLMPDRATTARQVMDILIDRAAARLDDALRFCLLLPRRQYRIRLFCLTPLFFAVQTLTRCRHDPRLLDPTHKTKIPRAAVARTILVTRLIAAANRLISAFYRRLAAAGRRCRPAGQDGGRVSTTASTGA
jgi:farnesyl-diphosphate farnesyltransferase